MSRTDDSYDALVPVVPARSGTGVNLSHLVLPIHSAYVAVAVCTYARESGNLVARRDDARLELAPYTSRLSMNDLSRPLPV